MKNRIKTLVIEASGYGWKTITFDTLAGGVLGLNAHSRIPWPLQKTWVGRKIAGRLCGHYENLSYMRDRRDAFCASPLLDVTVCNLNNLINYSLLKNAMQSWPLIIILHSAFGDNLTILQKTMSWFQDRKGKLAVFIGNEYDLMAEKLHMLGQLHVDYICSQLPLQSAQWVYADCQSAQVLPLPHALNPQIYYPKPDAKRHLDIAFRGVLYPYFIGDDDRTRLIRLFEKRCPSLGLHCEISTAKLPRKDWAFFLNTTKGIIGGESGTSYLDRQGRLIMEAKQFLLEHPQATFSEVFNRFFASPRIPFVSGKCISSRHFEPIGTKTCQILLEGDYNGILQPDEHYISVKKNMSNINDAISQFKDDGRRMEITERAYAYVMEGHTYDHRIRAFVEAVS